MKASTTLLLLLGSISLSEAVKIEQKHQQTAPNLNDLVQTERTDKPKKINIKKDNSQILVEVEKVPKFSAKEQLNKNAKVKQLGKMEEALQKASIEVHQQAEKEETAHKSAVATSALSKLKSKQMQEETQLKQQLAADEKRRMKELREGEEYARKVDQAEQDRASQEILAQERAKQMKELQEIEAEQRKDADKEEQEFLSAQAIQETKALAAKKAAQKAKIARIKRKHELERHNAEAKLQLFKMQQQEEAESALKDQEAALEGDHQSDPNEAQKDKLQDMLQKGRSEASRVEVPSAISADPKPETTVEKIVKLEKEAPNEMEKEECATKKASEELKVKEVTKVESNLKNVLKDGLKEKTTQVAKIQKDLNDEYEKDQADLAKYEKNKLKSPVMKDIEVRAKTLQEQNKRDKYADELSKQEAEDISKPAAAAQAPTKINQVGNNVKNDTQDQINNILKSKNEQVLPVGQAEAAKPQVTAPKADTKVPSVPVAAAAAPLDKSKTLVKDMKENQAKMDKISTADKEKTTKLKDSLKQELKMFSVSLNADHYDKAIKIKQELSQLGEEAEFNVDTDEVFKSSFTFPQIANNDFAQEMLGQLQETQNLLAQAPENEISKDQFVKKALSVAQQLQERYNSQWVNPRDVHDE